MYFACQVSLAPIRIHPNERSEMVSQLLFGETVLATELKDNWRQVTCTWDGTTGWVDTKQLRRISDETFEQYKSNQAISLSLVEGLMASDHFVPLTLGAVLPKYDGLRCELGDQSFQFSGPVVSNDLAPQNGDWIVKIARRYLHAPYLWGGRSPFGIDAPGLVQMVYKIAGIRLMRDPMQQVSQGRLVDFMEQCQAGDLAFFDNGKGDISHVGIILPNCYLIHASGKVRIDKVDHFGLYNSELSRYTHQLRIVRRMLPDEVLLESAELEEPNQETLVSQVSLF